MENNIEKIITLSKEKEKLLDIMLDLTIKQGQIIEDDDLDGLALILNEKENIMAKVDGMDIEFLKLYDSLKVKEGIKTFEEIDVDKYNNIKDLKDIVRSINTTLRKISKVDKENTQNMKISINNVKLDIKNVKKGKRAYKGYNYENTDSMLIDEKK